MFPGGMEIAAEEIEAATRVLESKNVFRYYGVGDGPHRQCLGQTGHAFEQYVAVAEQPNKQAVKHIGLPHDHFTYLAAQGIHEPSCIADLFIELSNVFCGFEHSQGLGPLRTAVLANNLP